MNKLIEERTKRTKWYRDARFGMFIHWGLYAIPARGEWVRSRERIKKEDYDYLIDEFDCKNYNPKEWARLAKKAGMQILEILKADLVREFLEAFRAEGIRVGLYFSIIDWRHEDFPHYGDMHHPMRDNEEWKGYEHNFDRYLEFMHAQVKELVTNYGKLDLMWFDFSYGPMNCEKWKAKELMEMVRTYQPDIITDNRLEGSAEYAGTIKTLNPSTYAGDFASPEQMIPPEGIVDEAGNSIPWEACITLNNNWGYHAHDKHFKSDKLVIRMLVECVSKNGNLILNVGPDASGRIPKESSEILEKIGSWMDDNGKSIYGCGISEFAKPEWGRFTQNGKYLYAHVMEEQAGAICLSGMANKIKKMRLLKDGTEVLQSFYWNLKEFAKDGFFFFDAASDCYPLPDDRDTVVEIELKEE